LLPPFRIDRQMTLAEGFEYVFLLTFEDKENRNSFLHTTANINLMEEIEEYASKVTSIKQTLMADSSIP